MKRGGMDIMGYEGFSITGDNEEKREKIREAALKEEQMEELEQAIKSKLESEIENFTSDLKEQNKLSDIAEEVNELKGRLEADEGGAKDAIEEKMKKHYNGVNLTNDTWEEYIDSFGFSNWLVRLFR